jgi:Zn-dependent protease with chaperone function
MFYLFSIPTVLQFGLLLKSLIKPQLAIKRNIKTYPNREEFPEIIELAKEMNVKLNYKKPFILVENFNNMTYSDHNQLILGKALIEKLSIEEQRAAIAHEFGHVKKKHLLVLYVCVLVFLYIVYVTVSHDPPVIFWLIELSVFILILMVIIHRNEYSADTVAAKTTSIETVSTALKKTIKPQKWSVEDITHPSVNKRIARLNKQTKRIAASRT